MQKDYSVFQIPNLANRQVTSDDEFAEIYEELNAIAEEIEQCRLKSF